MISISPCISPKVEKTGVNLVSDPPFINPPPNYKILG